MNLCLVLIPMALRSRHNPSMTFSHFSPYPRKKKNQMMPFPLNYLKTLDVPEQALWSCNPLVQKDRHPSS